MKSELLANPVASATAWTDLVDRLDQRISSVIQRQLNGNLLSPSHIATGFGELIKMRMGRDPDWSKIGVPAAYTLRYVPHRVSAIAGLRSLSGLHNPVRRVFDIGSGTDVVSVTLALLHGPSAPTVTAIEPSQEMSAMGDSLVSGLMHKSRSRGTTSDAFAVARGTYDLVSVSAGLRYDSRYGDDWWGRFVDGAANIAEPGGALVVAEPRSRAPVLDALRGAVTRRRIPSRTFSSDDYSKTFTQPLELNRCTAILRYVVRQPEFRSEMARLLPFTQQLVGDPVRPILSWHDGRPENAIVAEFPLPTPDTR